MVAIPLVIGLIFAALALIWMVRSKEWLQTGFAIVAMVFLSATKPEFSKAIYDFFNKAGEIIINLFN